MTGTTAIDEARDRSVSDVDGGVINCDSCSKVEEVEYCCAGNLGRYTGEVNEKGKPHGHGSFVREGDGGTPMIYVGTWRHGERVREGRYYTNGRLLGNVVWDLIRAKCSYCTNNITRHYYVNIGRKKKDASSQIDCKIGIADKTCLYRFLE